MVAVATEAFLVWDRDIATADLDSLLNMMIV